MKLIIGGYCYGQYSYGRPTLTILTDQQLGRLFVESKRLQSALSERFMNETIGVRVFTCCKAKVSLADADGTA